MILDLKYTLALSFMKGIGNVTARQLIERYQSAQLAWESVCADDGLQLALDSMDEHPKRHNQWLDLAEQELDFCSKNNIHIQTYFDEDYPALLKTCTDAPLVLFTKGHSHPSNRKHIALVGTRKITAYGLRFLNQFMHDLKEYQLTIVSGLAYGCDIEAQKLALELGIPTWAVMANSLGRVYPSAHRDIAHHILGQGGWISESPSFKRVVPEFFVKRNRIIAGMSHITVVIESGYRGGSLATAKYAHDYNRPVFALPGRVTDLLSEGCNALINNRKAKMLTSADDVLHFFQFNKTSNRQQLHVELDLSEDEKKIFQQLQNRGKTHLDQLSLDLNRSSFELLPMLLNLELRQVVKSSSGNYFEVFT